MGVSLWVIFTTPVAPADNYLVVISLIVTTLRAGWKAKKASLWPSRAENVRALLPAAATSADGASVALAEGDVVHLDLVPFKRGGRSPAERTPTSSTPTRALLRTGE